VKQTAVEWLEENLDVDIRLFIHCKDVFEQAKEMEKQQMKEMYSDEEVYDILIHHTVELFKKEPITLEGFWNKFKKK
jgi:hypothetical protein